MLASPAWRNNELLWLWVPAFARNYGEHCHRNCHQNGTECHPQAFVRRMAEGVYDFRDRAEENWLGGIDLAVERFIPKFAIAVRSFGWSSVTTE